MQCDVIYVCKHSFTRRVLLSFYHRNNNVINFHYVLIKKWMRVHPDRATTLQYWRCGVDDAIAYSTTDLTGTLCGTQGFWYGSRIFR
jgi:hypothetical protein